VEVGRKKKARARRPVHDGLHSEEIGLMKFRTERRLGPGFTSVKRRHSAEFRRHWAASIFCYRWMHLVDQPVSPSKLLIQNGLYRYMMVAICGKGRYGSKCNGLGGRVPVRHHTKRLCGIFRHPAP
jgi:hypothetical protein